MENGFKTWGYQNSDLEDTIMPIHAKKASRSLLGATVFEVVWL